MGRALPADQADGGEVTVGLSAEKVALTVEWFNPERPRSESATEWTAVGNVSSNRRSREMPCSIFAGSDHQRTTMNARTSQRVFPAPIMKTSLILLAALLSTSLVVCGLAQDISDSATFSTNTQTAVKFGVHEITLTGDGSVANPFDTIAMVTFTPPSGAAKAKTVHAFFDGENVWVRGCMSASRVIGHGHRSARATRA